MFNWHERVLLPVLSLPNGVCFKWEGDAADGFLSVRKWVKKKSNWVVAVLHLFKYIRLQAHFHQSMGMLSICIFTDTIRPGLMMAVVTWICHVDTHFDEYRVVYILMNPNWG